MAEVLSDADVGLEQVLSDADVGLGTPQRNIEGEREALRGQVREARAEAIGNKAIQGLADIGYGISHAIAQAGAKVDPTGVVANMLAREGYQPTQLISPEAVTQDLRTIGEFAREGLGNLGIRPGPLPEVISKPVEEFAAENIAAIPEMAPQLLLGKFQPRPVGRLFQAQMGAQVPAAVGQLAQAETPEEAVKGALQVGAAAGFPALIELGQRPRLTPIPDIPGRALPMPEGARPAPKPKLPKPEVPETPAEAQLLAEIAQPAERVATPTREISTWDDAVQILRERGNKQETKDQIRALFPQLQLSREAAGGLAKDAWGEEWKPEGKAKPLPTERVAPLVSEQLPPGETLAAPPTTKLSPEAEKALAESEPKPASPAPVEAAAPVAETAKPTEVKPESVTEGESKAKPVEVPWANTPVDEMFAAPLWTEKYKGMTQAIRDLRERSKDNPIAGMKVPAYEQLTAAEKQDLLAHGFTWTVDRMGKPLLKISQQAATDTLRRSVMEKAAQKPTPPPPSPEAQAKPVAAPTEARTEAGDGKAGSVKLQQARKAPVWDEISHDDQFAFMEALERKFGDPDVGIKSPEELRSFLIPLYEIALSKVSKKKAYDAPSLVSKLSKSDWNDVRDSFLKPADIPSTYSPPQPSAGIEKQGKEGKEVSAAKVSSAASRFRPREQVLFETPLRGPSGAKLTAYEWKWQPEEFVDKYGEERTRRVSNWEEAESSADTGRDIVHQFLVELPNGEKRLVSAESVPVLLGFTERGKSSKLPSLVSAAKTLAKLRMKLAATKSQNAEYAKAVEAANQLPLPEITSEPAITSVGRDKGKRWGTVWKMGDSHVIQHDELPINAERRDALVSTWRSDRVKEMGAKPSYASERDLQNRIDRQQRKLNEITGSQSSIQQIIPGPGAQTVGETQPPQIQGTQGALGTPSMVPTAPAPTPPTVPIKAVSQIIRDLSKGLNVPIRFGRLTTTKYAGYFKKIPNLIGSKRANDLPVVSHEIGHKLDSLYSISSDPTLRSELDALGDPARLGPGSSWTPTKGTGYKMGEGVAEFIRQWIDDPTHTASVAPNMHRYFESLLNSNQDMGRVLRQAQENVRLWKTAPPLERLDSSIVRGEGPVKARYTLSNLTRDLVDDLHFLKLATEEAKKTTTVPASKDPYVLARLLRGTFGMADTFIRKGVVDFKTKAVDMGTGLEDILKPVSGRINDFRRFIIAKRAKELMDRGKNTGLQPGDVAEALRVYQNEPGFQQTFDRLKQWNDSLLQYAFDAGMLKPETVRAMRELNQDYVPFHRFFEIGANELNAEQGAGTGRGLNVGTPGSLRRLKGSNRDIVDPLETMVRNAYAIITASEKNALNVALADLADKPNMGKWVEHIRTPIDPHKVTMADIRKKLEDMGADVSMIPDDAEFTFFRRAGRTPYGENIIKVVRNGNAEYYRVNGDLYETFHALDYDMASKFIRLASMPAQLLRSGVTLSPDFALRNPIRDTFSSAVISKYSMVPFLHTAKGVFHLISGDNPKLIAEWAASGGKQAVEATYFDAAKIQKFLRDKITKEQSPTDRAKNIVTSPMMALRMFTGLFEEGTRLGQYEVAYKKLIREGVPEGDARQMAAFEARDLQDFAKGGANTKSLRMLTPFWNAALQGNVRLAQAFRERPVQTIAKGLAFITLPKLIEQAINWNNDDYWDRPQWERDLFFMYPYGKDENGKTKFIRVPIPFEVGLIFGSFPGRIVQWAKQHDPESMKGFPRLMLQQTVPNPIPQWALTMGEISAGPQGYSFWRGRPIVPGSVSEDAPELQFTEQNSLTARKAGKALGLSPAKIDYAIQGLTGGVGKTLTHQVGDRVIQAITGEKPTAQNTLPGSSFVTTPAGIQSESVERFYRKLKEAKEDVSRFEAKKPTTGDYRYSAKLDAYAQRFGSLRKKARQATDPVIKQKYSLEIARQAKQVLDSLPKK